MPGMHIHTLHPPQVVAAVNQQLGELAARRAELQHELGASKERWQAEEAVRVR